MTQLLVIVTLVGFLIGCVGEQRPIQKPCAEIKVNSSSPVAPVTTLIEEPKAETMPAAKEKDKLIVITNEANYERSKDVVNFIATRGITIERIAPADFEKYKTEKYILILGGPNDDEGLGDVVKQVLTADEVSFVSQTGNKNLYLKLNKWSEKQNMLVIAGYDPDATFREFVNSKDKWWGYISSWFNIELSHDEVYGY